MTFSERDRDWGRPHGRPFSPDLLTLEEWLILYQKLPAPGPGERDYIRVIVPIKMELYAYDSSDTTDVAVAMPVVEFRGWSYFTCHGEKRGYVWHPVGASEDVIAFLRVAGRMNPLGGEYS